MVQVFGGIQEGKYSEKLEWIKKEKTSLTFFPENLYNGHTQECHCIKQYGSLKLSFCVSEV